MHIIICPPLNSLFARFVQCVSLGFCFHQSGYAAGCSSARRAAAYGAKVCLIESAGKLGGTCVNVGCVPKKIMFNAGSLIEAAHGLKAFCFEGEAVDKIADVRLDWAKMRTKRDKYIERLNGIYARMQGKDGVEVIMGTAKFTGSKTIVIAETGQTVTGDHVLIGVGGFPRPLPKACPGAHLAIDSDGFFEIESTPSKVAVIGAGYIACEMAGIFAALGIEVHQYVRSGVMSGFDPMLRAELKDAMRKCEFSYRWAHFVHPPASFLPFALSHPFRLQQHTIPQLVSRSRAIRSSMALKQKVKMLQHLRAQKGSGMDLVARWHPRRRMSP